MPLVVLGGNLDPKGEAMGTFVRLAGGIAAKIGVLTTASADPGSGAYYRNCFTAWGVVEPVEILDIHSPAEADIPQHFETLGRMTALFITGGDQIRLPKTLEDSRFLKTLRSRIQQGLVVGGTSAGAAGMSRVMIASGFRGQFPRGGAAKLAEGLGFEPRIIFDQHFSQRSRLGRLAVAVSLHPDLLGVGVDEDTCVVVDGDRLQVSGRSGVTIVDGRTLQVNHPLPGKRMPACLTGVQLHFLTSGCIYSIPDRQVVQPPAREI